MATVFYTFSGTVKWAKVYRPDKFGNFTIDFYPKDKEVRKAIKDTGIRNRLYEDDEGNFFYRFRRAERKENKKTKEMMEFGPPKVLDSDGEPMTDLIGNGSEITVKISVYDFSSPEHGTGKGHRLEEVMVENLVEYKKEEPVTEISEAGSNTKSSSKNDTMPF